ncbi:hypothetical protein UlMin_039450 [Ulmus minor]
MSKSLVKALNLPTKLHPSLYPIGWIKKGLESKVIETCKLSISIGKHYKDVLLCDVVDMDACHVLLGQPWQYDRKVVHDGEPNTYSFHWQGRKIVLLPLRHKPEKNSVEQGSTSKLFTVTRSQFEHEVKKAKTMLVVVLQEQAEQCIEIPHCIQKMLDEFKDVVPDKLPNHLPPMRHIQHCIDFIPGASLPNLPHYRMSLREHDILQA